ncbi:MAG: hypothetical protein U5K38_04195 [Woeseiaceae bacterium]|nr:hypothetical protein [Woeseiaceae bacterium]
MSFNLMAGIRVADWIPLYGGKSLFDSLDFTVASVLLPVNGLLIALFAGWAVKKATSRAAVRRQRQELPTLAHADTCCRANCRLS